MQRCASAANRTRGIRLEGGNFTTKLQMPLTAASAANRTRGIRLEGGNFTTKLQMLQA
jgi:hypothetical protein